MLRSLKEIKGYELEAIDGDIGRCRDFLIEDKTWTVRYMVADTGKWLPGRRVVVSPIALGDPAWTDSKLPVRLTKKQIEDGPDLDEHAPVSRQYEIWYHKHYGWPFYWGGGGLWATSIHPRALAMGRESLGDEGPDLENTHLHSADEVMGYDLGAKDGEIGHVDDFILDDETWAVRYLVAATRNWLPGKRVLIPPTSLKEVAWEKRTLTVDLSRDAIKNCPEYDPSAPINREYEEKLYDFVGRPHQWS